MEQTNVRKIRIMIRINEDEYEYLNNLKNRIALSSISEAIRYLIHRFKELEEKGYVVIGKEIFDILYKDLYNIALEEVKKELNRLFQNSSNKIGPRKPKVSNSL
jgi:predicted CopG family antitoxin